MKLTTRTARRVGFAAIAACAAILIPAVALAAPGRPAGSAGPAAAAVAHRCANSDLMAWVGIPGDGTAGTTYYELELSNISRHACTMEGYPGVSAFRAGGRQLGSAAVRDPSSQPRLITLRPGGTAHVNLGITVAGNFPSSACHPTQAAGLRVYPPNDYRPQLVPFSFEACQKRGPKFLSVTTTIQKTGIPLYSS